MDKPVYMTTNAGKQVERVLEQGYEVAAFNLYLDAIRHDVPLVMGEDSRLWHRDIQERTGWNRQSETLDELCRVLDEADEDPDEAFATETAPPLERDTRGRVTGFVAPEWHEPKAEDA